ncbi:MAG: sigma-54-dependent Fis family transcriptional regulator [Alphaproteobacteria bacterium]|nr:sigma-54-dependent Fis family transcriptional regulator [Alphaproteobacteria bacterium]
MTVRLLIVGRLGTELAEASRLAIAGGARITHAPDADTALDLLRRSGADLVMIDVRQPIAEFISRLRAERFAAEVVACGVENDRDAAVAAIRAGAREYVPLPPNAEMIAAVIAAFSAEQTDELVAADPATLRAIELARAVAKSEASILITGESGTGKEVIAQEIHRRSSRASKPLVAVNCAAIPEALLESELFGHEKGAFTGAVARRIGKFEEANGGTLLLDEISEMDVRLQAKLLRALQERRIDRVGGASSVPVDIRVLATSNRDLAEAVKEGTFREDLLYRLNVVNVRMPALRDRPGDIRPLATHFAKKFAEMNNLPYRPFDDEAMTALRAYRWPGNVRELENTVHRAVLLASDTRIEAGNILLADGTPIAGGEGAGVGGAASTATLVGRTVADVERDLIIDTLKHCAGNRTHAARLLGISIRTMRNKLHEYSAAGVTVPAPGANDAVAMAM